MKKVLFSLCLVLLAGFLYAQDEAPTTETPAPEAETTIEDFLASLKPQSGDIPIGNGLATLKVTEAYSFLGPEDTNKVLMAWGNPPSESLGMIYPATVGLFDDASWAVIITYEEDGYVKDDDADSINYNELLGDMQESTKAANEMRQEQGYGTIELVGWAEQPHYDKENHKLYWAKELRFGGSEVNTLNYNIRVLGRKGVLVLNAVANMSQLNTIKAPMEDVLTMAAFNEGHRYADFNPELDKVAAYGIGGLIAGKMAAKAGFFKVLIGILMAGKKFVLIGLVALGALLKNMMGRKKSEDHQA